MTIFQILKSIWVHPFNQKNKIGGIIKFFKWQINCRINSYKVIMPITENSLMIVNKGMTGVTGCIYNGLLEFDDMMFLLHFLSPDDIFVDVGANVGVYSILSAAEIGAKTISIEPIPQTFSLLKKNVLINEIKEKIEIYNIGIGESKGELNFTSSMDTVNHVVSEIEFDIEDKIVVSVDTLDDLLNKRIPRLIKIDVEGFEMNVINGGNKTLSNNELKGIIIELNGSGKRYGFDDLVLHNKLLNYGFKSYSYSPYLKKITELNGYGTYNTIYLRDIDFVEKRLTSSRKIKIQDQLI